MHAGTQISFTHRPHGQMEVVGHEAKANGPYPESGRGFGKEADEGIVIARVMEDLGAAVTAVEDVKAETRIIDPSPGGRREHQTSQFSTRSPGTCWKLK